MGCKELITEQIKLHSELPLLLNSIRTYQVKLTCAHCTAPHVYDPCLQLVLCATYMDVFLRTSVSLGSHYVIEEWESCMDTSARVHSIHVYVSYGGAIIFWNIQYSEAVPYCYDSYTYIYSAAHGMAFGHKRLEQQYRLRSRLWSTCSCIPGCTHTQTGSSVLPVVGAPQSENDFGTQSRFHSGVQAIKPGNEAVTEIVIISHWLVQGTPIPGVGVMSLMVQCRSITVILHSE